MLFPPRNVWSSALKGGFCLEARSCNMETRLEHKTTCFHRNDYIEYIKTYQLYLVDCPESSKLINDRQKGHVICLEWKRGWNVHNCSYFKYLFIFFQETYPLYLVNRLEARKAFTLDNLELIWHAWKQG